MQSLQQASERSARQTASKLLDVVPEVMYFLRASFRERKQSRLTVAQVRALVIVRRRPKGSLSQIADLLGISLSAASRVVDGLVAKRMIRREASARDRRNVSLMLTAAGERALDEAEEIGRASIAEKLAQLSGNDQALIRQAMDKLQHVFEQGLQD